MDKSEIPGSIGPNRPPPETTPGWEKMGHKGVEDRHNERGSPGTEVYRWFCFIHVGHESWGGSTEGKDRGEKSG